MAKPYPKEDHLMGNYAPLRMESNVDDLIIEGNVIGLVAMEWFMPFISIMEKFHTLTVG